MSKTLDLNSNQKKAIEHVSGPLIVVAGAGTGKTRVITERIKFLIQQKNIDSDSILALTFTEKAANEMLERIGDIMPLGYKEPWVSTFHSFADRILKREGLEIGLDVGYEILTYPKQWLLVRQNLFNFGLEYYRPLGNPTKFISSILKFISRLQDEAVSPADLEKFVRDFKGEEEEKKRWRELSSFYSKYQELKIQKSKMDFGDLITWCLKLFHERSNILKKYQEQFIHIMVDEFQDTNFAQYQLIKLLYPVEQANKERSLMVVGDDSQSIYKFRGAAVSNILEFRDDYKGSDMITLIDNYRSTQNILDPAYKLIQNNNPDTLEVKLGISKQLISQQKQSKVVPEVLEFARLDEEVNFVVKKIQELLSQDPNISYKDIAVLARANNHLDPFVVALRSAEIPYQLIGNRGLYDKDEVKNVLAFLRVLANPLDGVNLYRVLNYSVFEVPADQISRVFSDAKYKRIELWDSVKNSPDEKIQELVKTITGYQEEMIRYSPSNFAFKVVNETGMLNEFTREETAENMLAIKNLNLLLDRIKSFENDYYRDNGTSPNILEFLENLDLMMEAGDNPAQAEIEDIDTVTMSTVHSAKGLEYQAVFMVNLISGRFPSRERGDFIEIPNELVKETLPVGDEHIQEERRLFYVAMTRAKKYLYLLYSCNYGGKRDTIPSGFIGETGIDTTRIDTMPEEKPGQTMFSPGTEYRKPVLSTGKFALDYVNYTQINTFLTCPAKYKYNFVIKIPTPPSSALTFGTTIHATLRDFHIENKFKHNVSLQRLLELYKKNWDDSGYMDPAHRKERYLSGERILTDYYNKEKDNDRNVIELEKTINLRLAGVKFSGRIDRIDRIEGNRVEIMDYKTGKVKELKDIEKDFQTYLYAWGVWQTLHYEPEVLSHYYIEDSQKVVSRKTMEEIKAQVAKAEEVVETMKSGDFTPNPGFNCEWCEYKDLCPAAQKIG